MCFPCLMELINSAPFYRATRLFRVQNASTILQRCVDISNYFMRFASERLTVK